MLKLTSLLFSLLFPFFIVIISLSHPRNIIVKPNPNQFSLPIRYTVLQSTCHVTIHSCYKYNLLRTDPKCLIKYFRTSKKKGVITIPSYLYKQFFQTSAFSIRNFNLANWITRRNRHDQPLDLHKLSIDSFRIPRSRVARRLRVSFLPRTDPAGFLASRTCSRRLGLRLCEFTTNVLGLEKKVANIARNTSMTTSSPDRETRRRGRAWRERKFHDADCTRVHLSAV